MGNIFAIAELLQRQFWCDSVVSFATHGNEEGVRDRTVNGYYKDGVFYIISHASTGKVQDLRFNPSAALFKDLMSAHGHGEILGSPKEEKMPHLRQSCGKFFLLLQPPRGRERSKHLYSENQPSFAACSAAQRNIRSILSAV